MSPAPPISSATRLLAILGNPVAHSRSPLIHNAAMQALGLDGVYLALACSTESCPGLLRGLALSGGGGNITIPHKEIAARALDQARADVQRTGACNTYWLENGMVCGDNTDVEGFARAVQIAFGNIGGATALVLGAGGAARAVLAALSDLRVARVQLLGRTAERAAKLEGMLDDSATRLEILRGGPVAAADLIINATPLGLHDQDAEPFPLGDVQPGTRIFDLVYRPRGTSWVRSARAAGLAAVDGKEMLLQQARAAFYRWWGCEPPLEVMRAALHSAD